MSFAICRRSMLALAALFATVIAGPALACSCAPPDVDEADFLHDVDVMFDGELISSRIESGDELFGIRVGTFQVKGAFKGKVGATIDIKYISGAPESCGMKLPHGTRMTVVAYGDALRGYTMVRCALAPLGGNSAEEIRRTAAMNRARTVALTPPNGTADVGLLLARLRWLSEYNANEEGLEAAEQLLALKPNNRVALLYMESFLSALRRDTDALAIAHRLLVRDPGDAEAQRRRVLALIRLDRISEVDDGWRDFAGLVATNVNLSLRKLPGASFRGARLDGANFEGAILSDTDFSSSWLQVTASRADLSDANFADAIIQGDFIGTYMSGASLDRVNGAASFRGANLRGAILTSAELYIASFDGADLRNATLAGSCITGTFSGADLTGSDLRGAQIFSSDWTGASLRNADLRGARLMPGVIDAGRFEADLTGALYNEFTLLPQGVDAAERGAIKVDGPTEEPHWLPCQRS